MQDNDEGENPLGLVISDDARAEAKALSHVPDRDEVREVLTEYFIGPIGEHIVDEVDAKLREALDWVDNPDEPREPYSSKGRYEQLVSFFESFHLEKASPGARSYRATASIRERSTWSP